MPVPTKVIANLPYGVAASVILRTIELLPSVDTWVAMVQREVGERFAAGPGSGAYGVPSVLAQLACEVRVLRPVSRRVFHPVPNVDSVLVGLRRRGPAPEPGLRALVQQGFAHRRKALPRSLVAGGRRGAGGARRRARRARGDRAPARRARRAARAGGVAGAVRGDARVTVLRARAPGKVNLCLFVGEPREDGLHPLVSVVQALSLADELTLAPGGRLRTRSSAPASRGRTSRRARSRSTARRRAGTRRRSG